MAKDPDPSTGKLGLNKAGLQAFLDNRVRPFEDEYRKIVLDDPSYGWTMGTLLGKTDRDTENEQVLDDYDLGRPLAIGRLALESELHGYGLALNGGIEKMATSLVKIYEDDAKLFGDFVTNLETTIETLLKTQSSSLVNVDGQSFLDAFEDVSEDLGSSGSGSGSGGDTSD